MILKALTKKTSQLERLLWSRSQLFWFGVEKDIMQLLFIIFWEGRTFFIQGLLTRIHDIFNITFYIYWNGTPYKGLLSNIGPSEVRFLHCRQNVVTFKGVIYLLYFCSLSFLPEGVVLGLLYFAYVPTIGILNHPLPLHFQIKSDVPQQCWNNKC